MELTKKINQNLFLFYWIPTLLITIFILYFSLSPAPLSSLGLEEEKIDFNPLHILSYFFLSFFLGLALSTSKKKTLKKNKYLLAILFCLLFGIFNELIQIFIPGRGFSILDIIYNFIGLSLAQILTASYRK